MFQKIASKLKTLTWYLARPSYYKQLLHLIYIKISPDKDLSKRAEATNWCKQKSISTENALKKLGVLNTTNIEKTYTNYFEYAKIMEQKCPIEMGGPGDLNFLYNICEFIQAKYVIETGVAYGWSSLSILLSLKKRNGQLVSSDMPYAKLDNDKYVGTVVHEDLKKNWELIRLPDVSALPLAIQKLDYIDLCHYDSDKSYQGRKFAYPILWNKLRKGGYFISDDINDNLAFKEFAETLDIEPIVIHVYEKYVGVLIKK